MDTDQMCLRYAALKRELGYHEDRIEAIRTEMAGLMVEILAAWTASGKGKETYFKDTPDQFTIYTHRQLWARAKDGDQERAQAALVRAGLGDLIRPSINTQSLSAVVREWVKTDVEIPDYFREAITVDEVFDVRVRKAP